MNTAIKTTKIYELDNNIKVLKNVIATKKNIMGAHSKIVPKIQKQKTLLWFTPE